MIMFNTSGIFSCTYVCVTFLLAQVHSFVHTYYSYVSLITILHTIVVCALQELPLASPSLQLAQTVVDAGAIAHLAQLVGSNDAKLKRQLFSALSQVAKHTVELAEMVVEAEIFPNVLTSLKGT